MKIGGLEKFSVIDYPGHTCAIVFTIGCNFRCPYCHNPEIVATTHDTVVFDEHEVLAFLESRKGKLDGVTVTGGEPTVQPDLLEFLMLVKEMGYHVKLDSNGTSPEVLKRALHDTVVDYIAMDIKAPFEKYTTVTIRDVDMEKIKESVAVIKASQIDHEFRTTVVKSLLSKEDIGAIGDIVSGAKRYYLQKFIPTKMNDPLFVNETTYSDAEFAKFRDMIARKVGFCGIR